MFFLVIAFSATRPSLNVAVPVNVGVACCAYVLAAVDDFQ
jgi:hypothetical protein